MEKKVAVVPCPDYGSETVKAALAAAVEAAGGLGWVRPGMRIAVKTNLVARMKPETAAVTHPALVAELCRMLVSLGADVVVGDSPGGPFNAAWVNGVYAGSGIRAVEAAGAHLNADFETREVDYPAARTAKRLPLTSWLLEADAVIDFAKLKTHAMAGMTCAVKNFFGAIPGTRKPEFHYSYPRTADFCSMLVDLSEFFAPRLTLVDAVDCMEGNGPTQGRPRHMGALIASPSPWAADLLCAHLIGFEPQEVPTVAASIERGLCPASWEELDIAGDIAPFCAPDFEKMPLDGDITFENKPRLIRAFLERGFAARPQVDRAKCVGCGRCREVCPAGAAQLKGKKARIDRSKCIRCFCCQEFCPRGAITSCRPAIAKIASKL